MIDTMESAYRCVSGQYVPGDEKLIKTFEIFRLISDNLQIRSRAINSPCKEIITQLLSPNK
jgi:hypothetical protein